jgi:hypothetical protein
VQGQVVLLGNVAELPWVRQGVLKRPPGCARASWKQPVEGREVAGQMEARGRSANNPGLHASPPFDQGFS